MTVPESLVDWRGNAYRVGDTVLVPSTGGSGERWVSEGTVVKFTPQRVIVNVTKVSRQGRYVSYLLGERGYTPANITVLREAF